jgi:V-type H+-transporting ATPase subunit d
MSRILAFEADRRTINITLNSFGTELSKEQRARLFPTIGRLFPEGNNALARAEDVDSVKAAVEHVAEYKAFFDAAEKGLVNHADDNDNDLAAGAGDAEGTSLEDEFYKHEMRINLGSFLQQFQYSVFYSFIRLKEQEIRNLVWVSSPCRGCPFDVC